MVDFGREPFEVEPEKPYTLRQLRDIIPVALESDRPPLPGMRKLGATFIRLRVGGGSLQILRVLEGDVVRFSDREEVAGTLAAWARLIYGQRDAERFVEMLSAQVCRDLADDWALGYFHNALSEQPVAVRFRPEAGYCFHRLPFDRGWRQTLDAPTWSEILGRMSNFEAFAMRVASLLDPSTQRRQVVWLSGEANAGKSVVTNALKRLLGDAFTTVECRPDPFWKASLVGKRAVVMHEAETEFLRSPVFKAVTGDDFHLINEKGEKRFMARIDALFFMTSNQPPEIPKEPALLSRVIHCRLAPIPPGSKDRADAVEARLWEEFPAFLAWATYLYDARVGKDGIIPADTASLLEAADHYESPALDFLHTHFVNDPHGYVLASRMDELQRLEGLVLKNNEKGEWRAAWEREGVSKRKVWCKGEGQTRWAYAGIRERRPDERAVTLDSP